MPCSVKSMKLQLASWLINACGGEYIAEKASWFKSVLIFQGISIKPVVNALKVKKEGDNDPKMTEKIQESVSIKTIFFPFISLLPSLLSFGGQNPFNHYVIQKIYQKISKTLNLVHKAYGFGKLKNLIVLVVCERNYELDSCTVLQPFFFLM